MGGAQAGRCACAMHRRPDRQSKGKGKAAPGESAGVRLLPKQTIFRLEPGSWLRLQRRRFETYRQRLKQTTPQVGHERVARSASGGEERLLCEHRGPDVVLAGQLVR